MLRAGQGARLPPLQQRAPPRSHYKEEMLWRPRAAAQARRSLRNSARCGRPYPNKMRDDWKERALVVKRK